MASNFKIFITRKSNTLHIKMIGAFDGTSAFQLINILNSNNGTIRKIIVNTCGLSVIHPFGVDIFQNNFFINKLQYDLSFTGKYGEIILPEIRKSL